MENNIKIKTNRFLKMSKDITNSKYPENLYFDAKNIRLLTNKDITTGGFEIEKSNLKIFNIGDITFGENSEGKYIQYEAISGPSKRLFFKTEELDHLLGETVSNQKLIGYCNYVNGFILVTSNDNINFIWKLDINKNNSIYNLELLYVRDLKFSTDTIVQVINNYENEIINKIYMIDGKQQLYHLNIYNSIENGYQENLIDIPLNNIKMSGEYSLYQPVITGYSTGGSHKAGKVQYAYNLYNLNGSQTALSPLSNFAILNNNLGGGEVNEIISNSPIIKIENIINYSYIRIYSIVYSSYNVTPSINLIADEKITTDIFEYVDYGNIIQSISAEEFIFLGSNYIIPKNIESKNNRLFYANYKERVFNISEKLQNIDFRLFSFPLNSKNVIVYKSTTVSNDNLVFYNPVNIDDTVIEGSNKIDLDHSCINNDYNINKYIYNSNIIGGENKFFRLKILRSNSLEDNNIVFKDEEIYRFGIQFYNKYGQCSESKWLIDIKINSENNDELNLSGFKNYIRFELKDEFYTWLLDDNNFLDENGEFDEFLRPVGYKLLRADRTLSDRTILCQGLLNGMVAIVRGDDSDDNGTPLTPEKKELINAAYKVPSLMRTLDVYQLPIMKFQDYFRLDNLNIFKNHPDLISGGETPREVSTNGSKLNSAWQYNKIMQLFSPEITFEYIKNFNNCKLKIFGWLHNDKNGNSSYIISNETKGYIMGGSVEGGSSFGDVNTVLKDYINNTDDEPYDKKLYLYARLDHRGAFIGEPGVGGVTKFTQLYKSYNSIFNKNNNNDIFDIYGNSPEITEVGQGRTFYKNDGNYEYYNSWEQFFGDVNLNKVNSWGGKCATLVLGKEQTTLPGDRVSLTDLANPPLTNYDPITIEVPGFGPMPLALPRSLVGEFVLDDILIYTGGIYGGNSIASKQRTNYIEIGNYSKLDSNYLDILNGGDTYVDSFKFTKLVKTNTEIYNSKIPQFTEIIDFRVETSIDLKNRNDLSKNYWSDFLQPKYADYHKYNMVYSQQPNLIIRRPLDYRFINSDRRVNSIIASKKKSKGEFIDSWLELLYNEVLELDGKYGEIRNLLKHNDNIFSFQDTGVSVINIEPRTQIQGDDGISIELGKGDVLSDYKYISTSSGSINKFGIISTQVGIFYIDLINKSLILISNDGVISLSEQEGFHKEFLELLKPLELFEDAPLLNKGVILGFNKITSDLFISVFTEDSEKTLVYNIKSKGFSSYYDYNSKFYMDNRGVMLTINHNNDNYMEFHGGEDYGNINEETRESYIEFVVNPEPEVESTFNNIEFKSEKYDLDKKEVRDTWDKIEVKNEFQEAEKLINRNNSRMLNRKWRINIPRNQNDGNRTRDRIRNTWCNIKLTNFNDDNHRLITHDISTYYIPHYKLIQ